MGADAAEVELLVLAVEWAHAHPALPGQESWGIGRGTRSIAEDEEPSELDGLPSVR